MTNKHTPGPWRHSIPTDRFVGSESGVICRKGPSGMPAAKDWEANARLIAAAPDLLNALELLSAIAEMTTFSDQYPAQCEIARAAIAKARGE